MSIEEKFNKNIEEWKNHCYNKSYSSNPGDYVDCKAYIRIINMGKEILPLIRILYDSKDKDAELGMIKAFGLPRVLSALTLKKFKIPKKVQGRINEITYYTKKWLDENID